MRKCRDDSFTVGVVYCDVTEKACILPFRMSFLDRITR